MKKLLALLLALALILSCLTGCQKPAASKDESEAATEGTDTAEEKEPAEEPEKAPEEAPEGLGDVPEAPEEETAEEPEKEGIDIGGLLGTLGELKDAEGDVGAILGIIGDEVGGDLGALIDELEALGLTEYIGKASLLVSGEVVVGTYDQLLLVGFTSDTDPEEMLAPGENSEPFAVAKGKTELMIRVANPTEEELRLGSCVVCYYSVSTGEFGLAGSLLLGSTSREDILRTFGAPYASDEESVTYHTTALGMVDWGALADSLGLEHFEDDFSRTLTFQFKKDKLSTVIMEAPYYLYDGLGDNVDEDELSMLEDMEEEEVQEIARVRASILRDLTAEFEARGIDARIDARTGEITMSDTVLFANNSADLTEEGKAYLDTLFAAYATVLLDEAYVNRINYIRVEGHASPNGTYEYNLQLSQRRAECVMAYCLESETSELTAEQRETLAGLMRAEGFSFTDPVYREDGSVDHDASRRVAIKFFITTSATKK